VKIDGATNELLRQVSRYAEHEDVSAILVVSTRRRHSDLPESLCGKPILFLLARAFL
jgi:hypothetical protein